MRPTRPELQIDGRAPRTRAGAAALALIACACLALSACSESSSPSATAAPSRQETAAYRQQRAQLLELISCARRRGIRLPPPTSANKIDTRGVNLRGHRRAELGACYQKVVHKAERQQEAKAAKSGEGGAGAAQSASTFKLEREQLMEVVSCARRHGIDLPEPDAHNRVNTRGLRLRGHRAATLKACVGSVARSAAAQESGPVVLGGPPG
jgi:hypothetical protein